MGEKTPFPKREAFEWPYDLSPGYGRFFEQILEFAKKLISPDAKREGQRRVQYWTALGLLRGVMSSPAAGIEMLNTRLSDLTLSAGDDSTGALPADLEPDENPVRDLDYGFEGDNTPTQVVERNDWTSYQRQQLRGFSDQLAKLSNPKDDQKLASTEAILEDWLSSGFNPVVFCRYIATANYVGEQLAPVLKKKFPKVQLQVISSELPDELRKQRIEEIAPSLPRVLIATDCLSEGVNLQKY